MRFNLSEYYHPYLKQKLAHRARCLEVFYGGAKGGGKMQPLDSQVLTPKGFKRMGDIEVGDEVSNPVNGGTQTVIQTHPQDGKKKIWKIIFDDGASCEVGDEHLWYAYRTGSHKRGAKESEQREYAKGLLSEDVFDTRWDGYRVVTTEMIRRWFEQGNGVRIPLTYPVAFTGSWTPMERCEPYLLGLFLGDGHFENATITSADEEIEQYLTGLGFSKSKHNGKASSFRAVGEYGRLLKQSFRNFGLLKCLSWEKFIPDGLLRRPISDRHALLQGLMDTDGTIDERGRIYYCTVSKRLAEDVVYLSRSLGAKARIRERQTYYPQNGEKKAGRKSYIIRIWARKPDSLFRLKRKRERANPNGWNGGIGNLTRKIVGIEYMGEKEAKCITVDSPWGLYITDGFIVTHNSFLLLWQAFVHCCRWGKDAHAVLFRRHYDDLKNTLILEAKRYWPEAVAAYNGNDYEFRFRNGALCQFRHMQHKSDVMKHFGRQYTFVGVDELTLVPEEEWYQILLTALRSPREGRIFPRLISCSNPRGPGHSWVQRRFRIGDEYPDTKPYWPFETEEGTRRIYIPSRVTDNKVLMKKDPDYVRRLKQLPENLRKAHLEGNWTLMEDTAFPEFNSETHVFERRFSIPADWEVVRVIDWGYTSSPFYVGWLAKDPNTFTTYLVDEWDGSTKGEKGGLHPLKLAVSDVAQGILDRTGEGSYPQPRITIGDTSMWRSGSEDSGPTVADLFLGNGVRPLKKANKDRSARFQLYHELLRESEDTGKPRFMVFPHCKRFISCMSSLRLAEDGSEDAEKEKGDDPYDAVGYGLMYLYRGIEATRRKKPQIPEEWMQYIEPSHNRPSSIVSGICPY